MKNKLLNFYFILLVATCPAQETPEYILKRANEFSRLSQKVTKGVVIQKTFFLKRFTNN